MLLEVTPNKISSEGTAEGDEGQCDFKRAQNLPAGQGQLQKLLYKNYETQLNKILTVN